MKMSMASWFYNRGSLNPSTVYRRDEYGYAAPATDCDFDTVTIKSGWGVMERKTMMVWVCDPNKIDELIRQGARDDEIYASVQCVCVGPLRPDYNKNNFVQEEVGGATFYVSSIVDLQRILQRHKMMLKLEYIADIFEGAQHVIIEQ